MTKVVYSSNKKTVGDGMRITRVSGNGTVFEVWTGSAFSPVELAPDAPTTTDPNTAPVGADQSLTFEVTP